MDNRKRPTSVTVIAWLVIAGSVLGLVALLFTIPLLGRHAGSIILGSLVSTVIGVIVGKAMLKGLNWGRVSYLFLQPAGIVLGGFLSRFGPKHVLATFVYTVFLVLLTQPAASAFFGRGHSPQLRPATTGGYGPDLRIFIGWMFAILGGILTAFGLFSPSTRAPWTRSNVNAEWGIVLLVFAAIMLGLGYRAQVASRAPEQRQSHRG